MIQKYLDKSDGESGIYNNILDLKNAKEIVDNARIYMDDMQIKNDLDHVNNMKLADFEVIRNRVTNECQIISADMSSTTSARMRLLLYNKMTALSNIADTALEKTDNELSDLEKNNISTSLGKLIFCEIYNDYPIVMEKQNAPRKQHQFNEVVYDIITSDSFADLIKNMDRESLRHIIAEENGINDLYKNFIKQEYLSANKKGKHSERNVSRTDDSLYEISTDTKKVFLK